MAIPVQLYGASLLGNATEHKEIRGLNNAPGGADGVDSDAQFRLGADNSPVGMLDRRHGICCGITIAWLVGFVHGRPEASQCDQFEDYFRDVLRFQGAYLKDVKGNITGIDELAQAYAHDCIPISKNRHVLPHTLAATMPDQPVWAAYLGIYHHAIGIGYANYRHFLMDPNAGLYSYRNKKKFILDLQALIEARRGRKNVMGPGNTISAYFYKAK